MIWVTAEDVVAIHSRIIQVSGGIDGLRDRAGLEADDGFVGIYSRRA